MSWRKKANSASGYTLLEIILVLAVMVLVAAMALPALQRSFTVQSVKKGAERVRAEMARARVKAMREDQVYAFFYSPGTSQFIVAPFSDAIPLDGTGPEIESQRTSHFDFSRSLLPRDVFFAGGQAAADSRSEQTLESADVKITDMKPILFYPDGAAQDAVVVIQNIKGDMMEVSVRGLTGLTQVRTIDDPSEITQVQ
jgi:type II secretory pathway pseudopilin PulG